MFNTPSSAVDLPRAANEIFQSSAATPRHASVVINNYNYGRFLRTAIDSVLAQTRPALEVIVVDDGSSDDSENVIRSYGDRIVPIFKSNGGMGSALNAGFARARGDVVFFLDADDSMYPDAIETVLSTWKPSSVMVQYLLNVVNANGKWLGIYPPPPRVLAEGDLRRELLATGTFEATLTSGLAFLRSALCQVMPLDEKKFTQAADGYMIRAVAMLGPVQAIHRCLARQCRHGVNDSEFGNELTELIGTLRKKIRYTSNELDTVRMMARRLNLIASSRLNDINATYLAFRILSLALEPETHPIADDKMVPLLIKYVRAKILEREPLGRRLAELALAFSAACFPRSVSGNLIRLRYVPQSRPRWLQVPQFLRAAEPYAR